MSSYAKLKELALRRAEEEQATLTRERELKEKDAAAKRTAREALEREQREREKKILVQKMAKQKEEEAREKARREEAQRLKEEKLEEESKVNRLPSTGHPLIAPKKKPSKTGSTKKIDVSGRIESNSKVGGIRRKRKVEEDDFVGNRTDRAERSRGGSSTSTSRKKTVPLTREEKQAIKRAREFGALPRSSSYGSRVAFTAGSSRSSPAVGNGDAESAHRPTARSQLSKDNGLVALGTKKRDQRTIDEIERDLRRLKEAEGKGKAGGPSPGDLERDAALLRRQRAMEEKRKADQEARERAAAKAADAGSENQDDDLFGSDSESDSRGDKKSVRAEAVPSAKKDIPANSPVGTYSSDRENGTNNTKPYPPTPSRSLPPISKKIGAINPADFLPGAPLRPEAMARLAEKTGKSSALATPSPSSKRASSPADASQPLKKSKKEMKESAAEAASSATPKRRETERDRFIREQQAKKLSSSLSAGSSKPSSQRREEDTYSEGYDSREEDEYETEDDEDEDEDEDGDAGVNYRDEIWKLFGKDRKQYASRVVDSDDDMEADATSVLNEELRSSRYAREEDQREEELERRREREKALRKKALAGRGERGG